MSLLTNLFRSICQSTKISYSEIERAKTGDRRPVTESELNTDDGIEEEPGQSKEDQLEEDVDSLLDSPIQSVRKLPQVEEEENQAAFIDHKEKSEEHPRGRWN